MAEKVHPKAAVFDKYSAYYDLLYRDKDYTGEARFVHECLLNHGARPGHMLELGCGTGRHARELLQLGWSVKGYDLSPGMVAEARRQAENLPIDQQSRLEFAVGDMATLRDGSTYDAVISLFHVLCYQTTNERLQGALRTAGEHLCPGGLFLFDFWFGDAVLAEKPSVRIKRLEDERIKVTRLSEPELDLENNLVRVNFEVFIEDRATQMVEKINEQHKVRYLFVPELKLFLEACGFDLIYTGEWLKNSPASDHAWYAWMLARRKAVPGGGESA